MDLDPFISSWDTALESLDYPNTTRLGFGNHEARSFLDSFSRHIREGQRSTSSSFLDDKFVKVVKSIIGGSKNRSRFAETVVKSTASLKELLRIPEGSQLGYLEPITAFMANDKSTPIATLNYDNVMESFCLAAQISCSTGIENWSKRFEVTTPRQGIFLMKLHGSLNWRHQTQNPYQEESTEFKVVSWGETDKDQPAIIFGQRDKLTTDGPFLDLLRAFRDQLFKSSHLVVIGYSFRDTHINNYIKYWYSRTSNRKLTIIDPEANGQMLPKEIELLYSKTLVSLPMTTTPTGDYLDNRADERIEGIRMMKMGAGAGLAALAREES